MAVMSLGSQLIRRRGGRQPGTGNRRTWEKTAAVLASGDSPLDYLLAVMRDPEMPTPMRIAAAKAAAPYVHPRLSAIQLALSSASRSVRELSEAELMAIAGGY